jgi:GT2 family glycosyltransferase
VPEGTARPLATIALPNYNGRTLLEAMLPSIAAQDYPDFEILVVDDASSDDSVAYLQEHWPQVRIVALERNSGVSVAMNACWRHARGAFVALLNTDVELDAAWLSLLVDELEAHPEAASATGKTLNYRDRAVLDGTGDRMLWSGTATRRGLGERDDRQYECAEAVFSACGGMAVYRREAFDQVGGFDEDFWAYMEDVDWGFRAQLAGFTCRYLPAALAYHMGSESFGRDPNPRVWSLQRRNSLWMVLKNYPVRSLWRYGHEVGRYHIGCALSARRSGDLRHVLRTWRETAALLPVTLRKRRQVQRRRRIGHRELERLIEPARTD